MAKHYFAAMTRNKTSLAGSALVIGSLTLMLSLVAIQAIGLRGGAYIGIVTFVMLPTVLAAGLFLIFIGIRRARKRGQKLGIQPSEGSFPVLDLNQESTRKALIGVISLGTISAVVLAAATYKSVEVMDSTAFCGTVCHTVMQPEYTAHQRSPHAKVRCAECHIGPGAGWFVKSKLSGAWQADRSHVQPLSETDRNSDRQPASGARDLRGLPLADHVRRRQAQGEERVHRR